MDKGSAASPTPAWPEWAQAVDESPPSEARPLQRFLVPALVLALIGETALLAGVWWMNRRDARSEPAYQSLAITSEPVGATVVIDGVDRGRTPVTFALEGTSRSGASSILVRQGSSPVVSTTGVNDGTLEITTEPPGLAVAVDGRPRGVSPLSINGLVPGTHEVAVTRGSSIVRRAVSVEAGVPTAVMISTPSGGIASGWLTISGPVPVQISEKGVLLGSSDAPRLLLPVGRHELELSNETFGYRVRRTVQIASDRSAAIALEPANGTLSVNAQPWGEVWIDGKRIGETPIGNLTLPIGNHELIVRHPQLGERHLTVAIGTSAPARVGIDLRQ
jgi:PEGA domain